MQAYDVGRFDPPAPVALVSVKSEQLGIEIHDVGTMIRSANLTRLPWSCGWTWPAR